MEEWEYLEGHRDLYKNVIMEVPQPLTSPDLSSKRTTPERCPRPLLPQDCNQEDPNAPQDHQGEDLTHVNTTETYVRGDEWCKEEVPTYDYPGDVYMVRASSFGLYIYPMRMPNLTGGNYFGQLNSPFCPVQLYNRWLFDIPRWQPFLLILLWVDLWSFIHLAITVWYFGPFPLCVYFLGKLYQVELDPYMRFTIPSRADSWGPPFWVQAHNFSLAVDDTFFNSKTVIFHGLF
ncbi:uncharacterized protein [Ranitomeya imitator]|uniref:uncharacterized protein isoform X1 n=1 Tax=Ranitomeya imitator TaxID=111125 RepID=UPI0037E98EEC